MKARFYSLFPPHYLRLVFSLKVTAFAFVFLFSCSSQNTRFLAEVEKLEAEISKCSDSLQLADTSLTGNLLRKSSENLKFIQDNFHDTMPKEIAIILSDYSASRKSLRMFQQSYSDAVQELNFSRNQLAALKTDIQNSLMDENQFADFYSSESKSVEKLNELVKNLVVWHQSAIRMNETKSPPVEKFISELKEKQKGDQ